MITPPRDDAIAFLNGQWIPASDAVVSVGDTGFVLGVTIAEQLRTFGGKIFHLDDHLARLMHSLELVGMESGMTRDQFAQLTQEIVAHNYRLLPPGGDLGVSVFVTPGTYPTYAPNVAEGPTVCLHTYTLPFHLWVHKYREGQSLVTTDVEQVAPQCWPPGLKCRSRMHYYLADKKAAAIDPHSRALMLDADGFVTEASTANLLIYREKEGLASPPSSKILHGISLTVVVELARQIGVPCTERDLTPDDVASADEVFLTSTPLCMLPVTRLNGRSIGSGRPGAMFHRILAAWNAMTGIDIIAQAEKQSGLEVTEP
jgi:branched-subunit amino acid aminotransferase/4-amino-4-deoxychorismate lyase